MRGSLQQALALWWGHPRGMLAAKAAVASTLAWWAVQPWGDLAQHYSFYAPLGAIIATTTSVVASVRASLRTLAAITVGALLALLGLLLPLPISIALGGSIAVAVMVGGWRRIEETSDWIPIAAMFVLIAGRGDPVRYALAYAGLTSLGALVGVAVNALVPQLPLMPAHLAQDRLRVSLADQLDHLSDALERKVGGREDWASLRALLARQAGAAESRIALAGEARRANWTARHQSGSVDRSQRRGLALHRLTSCVDDVIALVADQRQELGPADEASELRDAVATAFRAVADLLRETETVPRRENGRRAHAAVADLRLLVERSGGESFAAAAITLDLEKAVDAWA